MSIESLRHFPIQISNNGNDLCISKAEEVQNPYKTLACLYQNIVSGAKVTIDIPNMNLGDIAVQIFSEANAQQGLVTRIWNCILRVLCFVPAIDQMEIYCQQMRNLELFEGHYSHFFFDKRLAVIASVFKNLTDSVQIILEVERREKLRESEFYVPQDPFKVFFKERLLPFYKGIEKERMDTAKQLCWYFERFKVLIPEKEREEASIAAREISRAFLEISFAERKYKEAAIFASFANFQDINENEQLLILNIVCRCLEEKENACADRLVRQYIFYMPRTCAENIEELKALQQGKEDFLSKRDKLLERILKYPLFCKSIVDALVDKIEFHLEIRNKFFCEIAQKFLKNNKLDEAALALSAVWVDESQDLQLITPMVNKVSTACLLVGDDYLANRVRAILINKGEFDPRGVFHDDLESAHDSSNDSDYGEFDPRGVFHNDFEFSAHDSSDDSDYD